MAQLPQSPQAVQAPKSRLLPRLGLLVAIAGAGGSGYLLHTPPDTKVYFSPNGGCTSAITTEIAGAEKVVRVQAYYLTSSVIAQALVDAKKRDVEVLVIMDADSATEQGNLARYLHDQGVNVRLDKPEGIAHNKVIIIDKKRVITGSFNFTHSAETKNAENLLILSDEKVCERYLDNWDLRWRNSSEFRPPSPGANLNPITPEAAARQVGEECLVEMTVARVASYGGMVFLNYRHGDHLSPDNFCIVIEPTGRPPAFSTLDQFLDHAQSLVGKKVRVFGKVSKYRGVRPQIEVTTPSQLQEWP